MAAGRKPKKQRTSLAKAREIPETPGVREGVKEGVNGLSDEANYIGDLNVEMGQDLDNSPTANRKESIRGRGREERKSIAEENGVNVHKKTPPVRSTTPPIPGGKAVWVDCGPKKPHLTKAPELVDALDEGADELLHESSREERDELLEPGSLHWDDSEITGHDPSDPEDDGEGINGVGFRPTPAMARERAERRRRQIEGWKSREDREARAARAKRSEARRRKMIGEEKKEDEDEEAEARRVRFAEKERAMDVL